MCSAGFAAGDLNFRPHGHLNISMLVRFHRFWMTGRYGISTDKRRFSFFSFVTWNISHNDKELICFMWVLGARIFPLQSRSDRLWHSMWSAKTKSRCKSSYNTTCRILCSIHIQMLIWNKIIFLRQVLTPLIQTVRNRPSFSVLKKGEVTDSMRVCYYFKIFPLLTKYFEAREFYCGIYAVLALRCNRLFFWI